MKCLKANLSSQIGLAPGLGVRYIVEVHFSMGKHFDLEDKCVESQTFMNMFLILCSRKCSNHAVTTDSPGVCAHILHSSGLPVLPQIPELPADQVREIYTCHLYLSESAT